MIFSPLEKKKNLRVENISTAFLCHTNKDSILVLVVVVKFSTHRTTVPRIPATYFTRFEASISDFWYWYTTCLSFCQGVAYLKSRSLTKNKLLPRFYLIQLCSAQFRFTPIQESTLWISSYIWGCVSTLSHAPRNLPHMHALCSLVNLLNIQLIITICIFR